MPEYKLTVPGPRHEAAAVNFISELKQAGSSFDGTARLPEFESYADWLGYRALFASDDTVSSGWVPDSTWFFTDKNEAYIYGMISLRHRLNGFLLREGGHIGYVVRPSRRRGGLGERMLRLALGQCGALGIRKALLCCDKSNLASAALIRKCGGVLENEFTGSSLAEPVQRYWIRPDEKSCGVIFYRRRAGRPEYLVLFQRRSRNWSFTKGHVEYGETETQTALRESVEETGLKAALLPGFRRALTYALSDGRKKTVVLFLSPAAGEPRPAEDEIGECRWADRMEVLSLLPQNVGYDAILESVELFLTQAPV